MKCSIDSICVCGSQVILEEDTIHQKVELPEIKPIVTEYMLQKGYCKACKKRISASLPEGVGWNLLRPNAEAIISSFTGFFINSKREVQQILSSIFNLNISLGLISKTEGKVSEKCISEYEKIREELNESKYLHIDETSQ